MENLIKRYLPYAVTILAIFLLVPLIFRAPALSAYYSVALYFIFPELQLYLPLFIAQSTVWTFCLRSSLLSSIFPQCSSTTAALTLPILFCLPFTLLQAYSACSSAILLWAINAAKRKKKEQEEAEKSIA